MANLPPSSCTMGRRSGGITGMQSSTMPIGLFLVDRNADTTFSRLSARALRWPLPVRMMSRSDCASPSRSKLASRSWIAWAPMPPRK